MSKRRSRDTPVSTTSGPDPIDPRVGKLRTHIVDLVEPWTQISTQVEPVTGHRRMVRIEHPSLLEQLDGAVGSTAGAAGTSARSKPPASLEATSLLGEISVGVGMWAKRLVAPAFLAGVKAGAGSRLRETSVVLAVLARRAPTLSAEHLDTLAGDVLTWWAHARVVTTWDSAPIKPHVPCVECGTVGKLQVRADPSTTGTGDERLRVTSAVCLECGAAWDRESIGILGDQIEMMLDLARPKVDVVAAVIDGRAGSRGTGRAGPWETPTSAAALAGVGPDRPWADAVAPTSDTTTASV